MLLLLGAVGSFVVTLMVGFICLAEVWVVYCLIVLLAVWRSLLGSGFEGFVLVLCLVRLIVLLLTFVHVVFYCM